ncbi:hypothetical protein CRV08_13885 [Halarcobacter ebronensis]|uniref:Flavinylation-associated cytochrome domain-containing protein n=1 Tax=Halarcobacter ebronensis TaxID=1462615 RepID=A0A4V1LQU5_9BACT|nr:DUF4405 domain-containing protein [Halarcobacter ebronensis]RXJ65918.1 hypothetical protein CRV08_13885 [Halarcobacter ebronensis]
MNLKKITSLTMLLSMFFMIFTGLILFIAPPGRVANWSNWQILGLSKHDYAYIHSTFMVLFIIMTILHLFYNWKPITSYMRNSLKQMVVFTKDMLVAVVLTLLFLIGSIVQFPPFSNFLSFGDSLKNSWEKDYGTAPYSHAELSSLKNFAKQQGYDLTKCEEILKTNNFRYETSQSLAQIAAINGVSPQYLFDLLSKSFQKEGEKTIPLTGLGRKTITEVAQTLQITPEEFISQLKSIGIEAQADEKFKSVVEKYDLSPMDVMTKLGYKK